MKSTTTRIFLALLFVIPLHSYSQTLGLKNGLQKDLSNVIAASFTKFHDHLGEELSNNVQSTDYRSLLTIKGAIECVITRHSATNKDVLSWQALMLKTEDFDEAARSFRSYYQSLQNLTVTYKGARFSFKGDYEQPSTSMKFTSIRFNPEGNSKVRVELLMENELLEWVVKILVFEQEREDDERGDTREQEGEN